MKLLFRSMLLHKGKYRTRILKADSVQEAYKVFKAVVTEEINKKAVIAYQRDQLKYEEKVAAYQQYKVALQRYKENKDLGKPKFVKEPDEPPVYSEILDDTRIIWREYPHQIRIQR